MTKTFLHNKLSVKFYVEIRDILMYIANADHPVMNVEIVENVSYKDTTSVRRMTRAICEAGLIENQGTYRVPKYVPSAETIEVYRRK